jgi:hypothetical protein
MSRPVLSLARASKPAVSRALIKQAVKHFRSDTAPRHVRRHNARAWLRSVLMLGDKHVYKGGEVKWGHGRSQTVLKG